ncbi:MAG: hypothetical protein MZV64_64135 [Ignavibacteriales bacterium]|nr:hypothetical protein [Ignavibacteriales bacterium]
MIGLHPVAGALARPGRPERGRPGEGRRCGRIRSFIGPSMRGSACPAGTIP